MKADIHYGKSNFSIDLTLPIDITIPVSRAKGPNAFYLQEAEYTVVEEGGFVGNVSKGGSCNCEDVKFNPHGNGTHTECAGHISKEPIRIYEVLKQSLFLAQLITVNPEDGLMITKMSLEEALQSAPSNLEAVVVRTLPNELSKNHRNYSGSNPPYFEAEAAAWLNESGVKHLITDLPSLDSEEDGNLAAHHAFFQNQGQWSKENTATEMVYIDDSIKDGTYIVEMQIAAFESDASPSRIRLFKIL